MSFDLAVWHTARPLNNSGAAGLYAELCESRTRGVTPHPGVDAFYAELTGKHPEIDTVPDDRIDDQDYSPWSCALDHSPGHVIMACVWPKAEYVRGLVRELATKYGLTVFDPQEGQTFNPGDGAKPAASIKTPWWRFW